MEQMAAAIEAFEDLKKRLASPKSRLRKGPKVEGCIAEIFRRFAVKRYLKVRKHRLEEQFRQGAPAGRDHLSQDHAPAVGHRLGTRP